MFLLFFSHVLKHSFVHSQYWHELHASVVVSLLQYHIIIYHIDHYFQYKYFEFSDTTQFYTEIQILKSKISEIANERGSGRGDFTNMPYDHYNNKIPNKTRKQVESFTSNKTLLSLQESYIKYKFPELSIGVCVCVCISCGNVVRCLQENCFEYPLVTHERSLRRFQIKANA